MSIISDLYFGNIAPCNLFSEGFRLGARLMLEILTKPDRQFI